MNPIIDISSVVLETERLILRTWRETDAADLFEYASVAGVGEMAGWKHHETMEESRQILSMFIAEKDVFAVVLKENNKVIGSLGLHKSRADSDERYSHLKSKEVGYVLSKDYWGMGLIPEAVFRVKDFCFQKCGVELLTCCHFEGNSRSRRVIEKCGFMFDGKAEIYVRALAQNLMEYRYLLFRP